MIRQSDARSMKGFIGLVLLMCLLFTTVSVSAQTITLPATDSAAMASAPAQIHYDLPYPGILPDHPLYFLKVMRDRLVGFLISDPVKKAEFNLLQSDKKLFAARMLFEDDKDELALETLSKSNNYMHNAISAANRAEEAGRDPSSVVQKIKTSIAKHKQAIEEVINTDTPVTNQLTGELKRLKEIEKFYFQHFPQKSNE